MSLSEDEFTCLLIASEGAPMMPIGRWKPAIEKLVELGLLRPQGHAGDPSGNFNCVITDAGRKACQQRNQEDNDAFVDVVNRIRNNLVASAPVKRRPHCGGVLDG